MNDKKKMRIRNVLTLMLVLDLIALAFLYVTTKNFLEISKDVYAFRTTTVSVVKQDPVVVTQSPVDEKKLEVIAQQHSRVESKMAATVSRSGDPNDKINSYVKTITSKYPNVKPELIMSIIYHESRYNPKVKTGNCVGLMQISTYWHADRASKLGVTDFYDSYSNILLGVDYISELLNTYKDPALVLMLYNMNHDDAIKLYRDGKITSYAKSVLLKAEEFKKGV